MRQPMVTRTFKTITLGVTAVNTSTKEIISCEVYIPDKNYNDTKLAKLAQAELDLKGSFLLVTIDNKETTEQLRAMSESDFLKNSAPYERKVKNSGDVEAELE